MSVVGYALHYFREAVDIFKTSGSKGTVRTPFDGIISRIHNTPVNRMDGLLLDLLSGPQTRRDGVLLAPLWAPLVPSALRRWVVDQWRVQPTLPEGENTPSTLDATNPPSRPQDPTVPATMDISPLPPPPPGLPVASEMWMLDGRQYPQIARHPKAIRSDR